MSSINVLKLALLDTNALVSLFTFWEVCQIAQVQMSSKYDWNYLRSELAKATAPVASALNRDDFQSIRQGQQSFQRLEDSKAHYDFLCCHVSRSELHHVLLSANASEELSRSRIPRSLANKRPLIVHQLLLPASTYSQIDTQIDGFFNTMRTVHAIDIKTIEDSANGFNISSEDIFETAKKVWSHVLMETMDAYIFAAAIEAEADYLITSDAAFRNTINNLRNGQGEWQSVSAALMGALGKHSSFSFPSAIVPTHTLS